MRRRATATAAERAAVRWAVPDTTPDIDPEDRPLRTAIYARQSKGKPKSIEEQLASGDARTDRQGWPVAARLSDGVSASRFGRAERADWPKVITMVKAGALDAIWLWESSRADRETETWAPFLAACRDHRVFIWVETDRRLYDLAGNPRDRKTLAEDGTDNEYESEKIAHRTNRAKDGARLDGLLRTVLGGPPPVGFQYIEGDRDWTPEPGQVAMLRDVASEVLHDGKPLAEAFRVWVREHGEPRTSPSPKWPAGRVINEKMLRAALQRPVTAGLMTDRQGRVTGQVVDYPPLDIDTYKALEEWFARNRKLKPKGRATTPAYPLGRILRCAKCGNQLTGATVNYRGTKRAYYRCGNPHPKIGVPKPCNGVTVPAEEVHKVIYAAVDAWWAGMPDWFAEEDVYDEPAGLDAREADAAADITRFQAYIIEARALRDTGDMTQVEYEAEVERRRWQIRQAREELALARAEARERRPVRVQRVGPPDWPSLPAAEQCDQIAAIFQTPIKVQPGNGGGRALTAADRITLTER